MAYRVEIWETVENATGLNVTGALVTVKYHGGANAPVYDAENGGSLLTQPLSSVNGKIGGDAPIGAWVAEGDYDLVVAGGAPAGGDLTFFWPARRGAQFVTTLPAGAGSSAPEDGEQAIELYDSTNGGAWLRRYRGAVSAWDMIGGPPPAGAALPGTPRTRQEFYVTGASPAVQHLRYNGASWDYVGTPPMVPVTGSPLSVLDTGQSGQRRAGRDLALVDFSTLCALPTTPVLLANLATLTSNLGTGGALTNKGTVSSAIGIGGAGATAARFDGLTTQALYIVDTGAADPFRIKTGSWSCWFRSAKRGVSQWMLSKYGGAGTRAYLLGVQSSTNAARLIVSFDGTASNADLLGTSDICDDRWHHVAATFDGTLAKMYVDGVLEATVAAAGTGFAGAAPLNIGGYGADSGTAATEPVFGRVDEAFVSTDVLSLEQIRLLYAAAIPHGYATTPARVSLTVRRRRRGASLVSGDFPSQPVRLHDGGLLTDAGSGGVALTANGTPDIVAGPDGAKTHAYNFVATSSQSLSSTDTGLPTTTTACSMGCWVKTNAVSLAGVLWYGTSGTNERFLHVSAATPGAIAYFDGANTLIGPVVSDGLWHHAVVVVDPAADGGLKEKLYLDGRLVASGTAQASTTLIGANGFRVGSRGAASFLTGQIANEFVHSAALTADQVYVLYQKAGQTLPTSIKNEDGIVLALDSTTAYVVGDTLGSQNQIDMSVAS